MVEEIELVEVGDDLCSILDGVDPILWAEPMGGFPVDDDVVKNFTGYAERHWFCFITWIRFSKHDSVNFAKVCL